MNNDAKSIKAELQKSVFNNLVLKEKIDEELLHDLTNSSLLQTVKYKTGSSKEFENEKDMLINFRKSIKDGYAYIRYTKNCLGRIKPDNGLNYLGIRRGLRHTLCHT